MNEKFSSKYDAWYNASTDEWLEDECDDPECEFCSIRPERPSDDLSLVKNINLKEVIADQVLEIQKLRKENVEMLLAIEQAMRYFTCVGPGPLNDNTLNFNKEQINYLYKIYNILLEWRNEPDTDY